MSNLRRLILAIMTLTLLFSSQQMAVARGQMVAMGEAVYCIGGQMVTVAVGADGQPVKEGSGYLCPDCVLSLADFPTLPVLPIHDGDVVGLAFVFGAGITFASTRWWSPIARGPPVLI